MLDSLPDDCRKRFRFGDFAMSVNGDAARRDMWAGRIERCLTSGMAIGEWCSLNKGEQVEPVQVARRLPRRGSRPLRREELGDVRMGEGGARRHRRGKGHRAGRKRRRAGRRRSGCVSSSTSFTKGTAVEILDRFGLGDLDWSRFLGRKNKLLYKSKSTHSSKVMESRLRRVCQ